MSFHQLLAEFYAKLFQKLALKEAMNVFIGWFASSKGGYVKRSDVIGRYLVANRISSRGRMERGFLEVLATSRNLELFSRAARLLLVMETSTLTALTSAEHSPHQDLFCK